MSSRGWLGGSFCIQNDTKSCQGFHRSLAIVLQCDKQIPLERKSLECNILRHCKLLALEVASVVVLFLLREIHCTNNSTSTAPPPTSSFVFKCLCNPKFEWRMLEYVLMYNYYFDDIVHRVCWYCIIVRWICGRRRSLPLVSMSLWKTVFENYEFSCKNNVHHSQQVCMF